MNREVFIADTAARILASSYANSKALPRTAQDSVDIAIELWDELVSKNIIPSGDYNFYSQSRN